MASDDLIYGLLLVGSIPTGLVFRLVKNPRHRQSLSAIIGILICLLVCKGHILHSIIVTLVNTVIVLTVKDARVLPIVSFAWCFSYLAFFRTCHWYGIPQPNPHSNAVQLLLTLRLVGLAAELSENSNLRDIYEKAEKAGLSEDEELNKKNQLIALKLRYKEIDTSIFSILSYSYSYVGLLTGPFYTCRTYQDWVNCGHIEDIPLLHPLKKTLMPLPITAVIFLVLSKLVYAKRMAEDDFYEDTWFFYRYGYLFLLFIWFRVRFYSAWILAECMCITAGLGSYSRVSKNRPGAGPTDYQAHSQVEHGPRSKVVYDFETIHNIDPLTVEFTSTIRNTIKYWNMTVQYWLAVHIYKRIPFRNSFVRGFTLMLISSFWHGVHPGYYFTLMSSPFILLIEDTLYRGIRMRLNGETALQVYDYIASFMRIRLFEYFSVGVFLLHYGDIWRFYSSVGFFGHYLVITLIAVGLLLSTGRSGRPVPTAVNDVKTD